MSQTRSRCRIVLGMLEQDESPGSLPAGNRYRASYVRREYWRAKAGGETLLVLTHRNALVGWHEPTVFAVSVPTPEETPELILRASGPLGAHDEAIFVRPPAKDADRPVEPWESILVTAAERVAVPLEVADAERRVLVVTYCSRRKNAASGDLPAIERYESPRIRASSDRAAAMGADFRILSGTFGLLRAEDPIPYYDHLLQPEEVAGMVERVIPVLGVYDEVVFTQVPGDYIEPYLAVVTSAAQATSTAISNENLSL